MESFISYLIYDRNGNLYTDISPTRATVYRTKTEAFTKLKGLPEGWTVRDATTKKKVEPY